jgi:UDP-N-acetylglucosamine 1-carboxyvinyltransferase
MSKSFNIKGGNPLVGTITPVPNKNAVLPALAASLLTQEEVTLKNIPNTTDVMKMLEIMKKLGVKVNKEETNELKINSSELTSETIDFELGSLIRASILFVGPLLARLKKARFPVPGGCELGKRSINTHLDAFLKVGVEVDFENEYVVLTAPEKLLESYNVWFVESSVTATENLYLYAAGTNSSFNIIDAASEPHISQLLDTFIQMGANIKGKGSNNVTIVGTNNLNSFKFTPYPDHIDIAGIIAAAGLTKGKLTIKDANIYDVVEGIIQFYKKWGIDIKTKGNDILVDGSNKIYLDPQNSGFPLAGDDLPKVNPRPWPGFPVDALPPVITLACKNNGKVLIQNWMYESGLNFVTALNTLGANIFIADPQRVIVSGSITFKGGKVDSPHVIEATKAIFLAALADNAETTINNVEILQRRYPDIVNEYKRLGASIETID